MAYIIELQTITDSRGSLTVIEDILPFDIKRVYYMYNVQGQRGGHSHKKTMQALVAVHGSCKVNVVNKNSKYVFTLDTPDTCLLLDPEDWHTMDDFSEDAVLLVLASELYDACDYVTEEYK